MIEIWKTIPGFNGYDASDQGRLRSWHQGRGRYCDRELPIILRPAPVSKWGHLHVCLTQNGIRKSCYVHRLVLLTFVGPPKPGQESRHLNGIPADNRLLNLAWGSIFENRADAMRHGTQSAPILRGSANGSAVLDETDIPKIRLLLDGGLPQQKIASIFGVSKTLIHNIKAGEAWRHVR